MGDELASRRRPRQKTRAGELMPLEARRRQSDPATKERIAELARQVAAGKYDARKRLREMLRMSMPTKGSTL
jgi:hypothetical protein